MQQSSPVVAVIADATAVRSVQTGLGRPADFRGALVWTCARPIARRLMFAEPGSAAAAADPADAAQGTPSGGVVLVWGDSGAADAVRARRPDVAVVDLAEAARAADLAPRNLFEAGWHSAMLSEDGGACGDDLAFYGFWAAESAAALLDELALVRRAASRIGGGLGAREEVGLLQEEILQAAEALAGAGRDGAASAHPRVRALAELLGGLADRVAASAHSEASEPALAIELRAEALRQADGLSQTAPGE